MLELTTLIIGLILYFFPAIYAKEIKHKNAQAICTANLFFGWTGVGWIICLIWSQCK